MPGHITVARNKNSRIEKCSRDIFDAISNEPQVNFFHTRDLCPKPNLQHDLPDCALMRHEPEAPSNAAIGWRPQGAQEQTSIDLVAIMRPDHTFVYELKESCAARNAQAGDGPVIRLPHRMWSDGGRPATSNKPRRHRWKFTQRFAMTVFRTEGREGGCTPLAP